MFETLGFETLTPRSASLWLGLAIGLAFGALAEVSRFCLRRGLAGPQDERRPALGLWLAALAVAVIGTQGAVAAGLIGFADHRFHAADLPLLALVLGGLMFGAGMVLARGCAARLTVLAATGNLRALLVLVVFALVAHAAMKGLLAPLRQSIAAVTLPLAEAASLAALPGGGALATALIALPALAFALRSGTGARGLLLGAAIGALVPLAWVGTGFVLLDDFDPIPAEALAFTAPAADTLFWAIASTAVTPGFGTGLVLGTLAGAAFAAAIGGRLALQSFESPRQTGRYIAGAVLMGLGGTLSGGCTLGAGLSGIPTLSVAALLALAAIVAGARLTDRLISAPTSGYAAPAARRPARQAA